MSTFASTLDKPANTIERLPPLPTGTYLCVVTGMPRYDASTAKKTKFIEFSLTPKQVADDVDRDALAEAGGLEGKKVRNTFYYERANGEEIPNAGFNIKEFIGHCGVDITQAKSLRELSEETVNASVMVKLKHEPTQDGKGMIAVVGSTGPVE